MAWFRRRRPQVPEQPSIYIGGAASVSNVVIDGVESGGGPAVQVEGYDLSNIAVGNVASLRRKLEWFPGGWRGAVGTIVVGIVISGTVYFLGWN